MFLKVVVWWRLVAGVLVVDVAPKHFPTIQLFPASLGLPANGVAGWRVT